MGEIQKCVQPLWRLGYLYNLLIANVGAQSTLVHAHAPKGLILYRIVHFFERAVYGMGASKIYIFYPLGFDNGPFLMGSNETKLKGNCCFNVWTNIFQKQLPSSTKYPYIIMQNIEKCPKHSKC